MLDTRLKPKDGRRIGLAGLVVMLASGVGWSDASPWFGVGLGVAVAILLAAQIEVMRRLLPLFEAGRDDYRQLESVTSLVAAIGPRVPLPAMRGWAVSPDFANIILQAIAETRPRRILECGSGISTILCAYAVEHLGEGEVIALEHQPDYARQTRARLEAHDLRCARVIDAELVDTPLTNGTWRWYDLNALGDVRDIDLLIVDGPPSRLQRLSRYPALPMLLHRMSSSAVVLIDDALVPDVAEMVARWTAEVPGLVDQHLATEKGTVLMRYTRERTGGADSRGAESDAGRPDSSRASH